LFTMDSDSDDMPPPLEDMSETLAAKAKPVGPEYIKKKVDENEGEEIRLGSKKPAATSTAATDPKITRIMPSDDSAPTQKKTSLMDELADLRMAAQEPAKVPTPVPAQAKKSGGGFGMKAGFLNGGGAKKKPAAKPKVEDFTHVKATPKEDRLKFDEVQTAMTSSIEKNKDQWLNEDLMAKIMQSPRLMEAFSNPRYMQAFQEMG